MEHKKVSTKLSNGKPAKVTMTNDDNGVAIILLFMPDGRQVRFTWNLNHAKGV